MLGRGTFNVGVFQGGERANIVPANANASIMIRTIEPRRIVEEKMKTLIGKRATMEVISGADPLIMHVVEGFPTASRFFRKRCALSRQPRKTAACRARFHSRCAYG